ncbi:MAG: four helix bundle protein [Candidatus Doudnabacteria bacterium]|nr:four helix bundle protein [Candidatus Doudnabacteria bacterium]
MIVDVEDLDVYRRAMKLIKPVYKLSNLLPKEEFRLKDQLTASAKSIPALIAEGFAKRTFIKEFKRFLFMALGSSDETITHLKQIKLIDFQGIKTETCDALIANYRIVSKQINTTIKVWKSTQTHI